MDSGTTAAHRLGTEHVGCAVSYGPALMFSGVVAEIQHLTSPWLKRVRESKGREVVSYPSPPRVLIRTTDGRAVTLSHNCPVYVQPIEGET
jgi:hypothetical protein